MDLWVQGKNAALPGCGEVFDDAIGNLDKQDVQMDYLQVLNPFKTGRETYRDPEFVDHYSRKMQMKQKAFREQVFKLLFRAEFNTREELMDSIPFYFEAGDLTVGEEDQQKIVERLTGILDRLPEIDADIARRLKNWKPERIGKAELAVIRMTAYELELGNGVPVGAIISDAVDIARKYGQEGAGQFVNGVLAAFVPDQPTS